MRWAIVFGGCLFGLAVLPARVGGGQGLSAAPAPATVRHALPKHFEPREMALASDGSVWVTDVIRGVTRVDASGRRQVFLKNDEEIRQLAPGANGAIWASGVDGLVRIDGTGRGYRPPDAGGDILAPAGDGGAWIANAGLIGERWTLTRVRADGTKRDVPFEAPRAALAPRGVAEASDGSVWFTESRWEKNGWIGRMTAAGAFTHWALGRGVGDPGRIAASPDGAAWFTATHVVGRITPSGQAASFRLPGDAAPHDIVAGIDGAMWWVSDACLGRIDPAGTILTWPVAHAQRLERIAAAPDGSLWLMDRLGDALFEVRPGAPAPCGAPTITRSAGPTSATLAFQLYEDDFFGDLHVRLSRGGQEVFSEAVPPRDGAESRTSTKYLKVRDLDGDDEPEVLLTLNWAGGSCCTWSRIYRYDRARNTYVVRVRLWGSYGAEPVLRDVDRDGSVELVSLDDRFSNRFTNSRTRPLRIWAYRHGKLRDVTRRYPRLIRRDASELWREYQRGYTRGALPAWMADQYLLGRQAEADRVLDQALARGELDEHYGYKPKDPRAFVDAVKTFLRRHYC